MSFPLSERDRWLFFFWFLNSLNIDGARQGECVARLFAVFHFLRSGGDYLSPLFVCVRRRGFCLQLTAVAVVVEGEEIRRKKI